MIKGKKDFKLTQEIIAFLRSEGVRDYVMDSLVGLIDRVYHVDTYRKKEKDSNGLITYRVQGYVFFSDLSNEKELPRCFLESDTSVGSCFSFLIF